MFDKHIWSKNFEKNKFKYNFVVYFSKLNHPSNMKRFFLIFAFAVTSASTWAQLAMTRSTFTGTYTPIISGGGGATLSTATGDDAFQDAIPLGFTFNYLGTNYTTFNVSTNGVGSFTSMVAVGAANSRNNANLFSTTTPNITLAPWMDDLTGDSIVYQTTGSAGSMVFTIQWNTKSYFTTSTQLISFQVKLYEGTNIIEFLYGPVTTGTISTTESASIGIEGGAGGAGNFIDGVVGSAFAGTGYLNSTNVWPVRHIRFTPGAPAVLPGGTYTVGAGQTYPTINEALADVNHRGISGPVVLSLTDATYSTAPADGDNIFPLFVGPVAGSSAANTLTIQPASGTSTLSYNGWSSGFGANSVSQTTFGTTSEPILGLVGADFTIFKNLNFTTTGNLLDRAIEVVNNSATNGSTNNAFENITITLNRTNTSTIAISQRVPTAPTSAAGANSNNTYKNLNISNTYVGINLAGNATFPDVACQIGNTSPTAFNLIGGATANDIGNGTVATQGIRATNQSGVLIYNNEVRNVASTAAVDGIFLELSQGNCDVYNNIIHDLRNTNTGSNLNIVGIRANVATTAGHNARVYNNFIYNLISSYIGPATAIRQIKGIFAQSAGGGVTGSSVNIDHNNVSIDATTNPNVSSTCFEIGTTSGPVINVRNNIFANFTTAQTAPAAHYTWKSTAATTTGNVGSVSNYNDLFIFNTTQGFIGQGNATDYATLADWQAAMVGMDANSISVDPGFTNNSLDLHVSIPNLDETGTSLAWVTTDIDNQARGVTSDIGADEFTPLTIDMGVTALTSPVAGTCYSTTQAVVATIRNFAIVPMDFSVNPTQVTINVTGAITTTLTVTLSDNSLNGGLPLPSGSTLSVPMGNINMSGAGTYTFNGFTTLGTDMNSANNSMATANITVNYGTAASSPRTICDLSGDPITLTATGFSAGFTIQWQSSPDGSSWTDIVGATTASYNAGTITDTTWYRASYCGGVGFSNIDTSFNIPVTAPTTIGDTVCGTDTLHLSASGIGTLNWYNDSSSTSFVYQGTNYSIFVPATDTLWVSSSSGGGSGNVGMVNNSAGGAQQASTNYNIFDVFAPCTLQGVTVYPGAAGNVVLEWRNSGGGLIQTVTYPVTAADINNPTFIPLNFALTPGTNYRLQQGTGSVSMFRNTAGVAYPYTLPGYVSITGSAAGATFYYWGYNWLVSTGCEGSRTPVVGVVTTAPAITATVANPIICEEDTTSLSVTSADTTYSYAWNNAITLADSSLANTNAYPALSTTYIVMANNPVGCITYDTVSIQVNPLPIGNISITDTIICIGDSAGIWFSFPGGVFTDSTASPIIDNATNTDTMLVAGQTSFMTINSIDSVCFNATHTWDSDVSVTLISPQGTQLLLVGGEGGSADNFTQVCFSPTAVTSIVGAAAPFTGTWIPEGAGGFGVFNGENANGNWLLRNQDVATGDQGAINNWTIWFNQRGYSYAWSSSTAGALTDTTDSIHAQPIITTVYTITVTDTVTGCVKDFPITLQVRDSLDFVVNGLTDICPGDSTQWFVAPTGGDGNYSYIWSNGLGTNDTTAIFTIPFDFTFGLTITDGCGTPAFTDSVTLNLYDNNIAVTVNDTNICFGTDIDLPSTVTGGSGVYSYLWSPGASVNDTLSLTNVTTNGTYTLQVTDACGFTGTDQAVITVDPLPVAGFTSTGSVASFNFTNTSTNATSYLWNFGDAGTSTATNPSHTYTSSGLFTVTLIATNNCGSDTITATVSSTLGIEETGIGNVAVYPNPSENYVNITIANTLETEIQLELFDLSGQLISTRSLYPLEGSTVTTIDVTTLASGMYNLRLTGKNQTYNLKLVRK
jgi:subtilisin-like proprotein convertase family protein